MTKYDKLYNAIIERAKHRDWKSTRYNIGSVDAGVYVETHHVIPKCMGGSNDRSNLVVLSAKEHFICHLLLTKMYSNSDEIMLAFKIMCNRTNGKSSTDYAILRERYTIAASNMYKKRWDGDDGTLKEHYSKMFIEKWKEEDYINKVKEGIRLSYANTDHREKVRQASLLRMADKDIKKKWYSCFINWSTSYWTEDKRKDHGELIKKQNRENPELCEKRNNAINYHKHNKSEAWKGLMSDLMKEYNTNPDVLEAKKLRMTGVNSPVARKVINLSTMEVYISAVEASNKLNVNLSTLKKDLYKGKLDKFNCMWYDNYILSIKEDK